MGRGRRAMRRGRRGGGQQGGGDGEWETGRGTTGWGR